MVSTETERPLCRREGIAKVDRWAGRQAGNCSLAKEEKLHAG